MAMCHVMTRNFVMCYQAHDSHFVMCFARYSLKYHRYIYVVELPYFSLFANDIFLPSSD